MNIEFSSVHRLMLLVGLLLLSVQVLANDIQIRVDRNPVGLNESFLIEFKANKKLDADPDFSVLDPYVEILNQSQSSSVNIINGRYKASTSWLLTVMPKQQGELVLPSVEFGKDTSPTFTLTVKAPADRPDEQSAFFTRVRVSTQELYAQQQLIVTQQLFSAYSLSAHEFRDIDYSGVEVVSELLGDVKTYTTRVGQRNFAVVEKQFAVFPQSSGELTIGPVVAGGRQKAIGGLSYDPFGGNNRILSARSKAVKVRVLPIPGNAVMDTWLPANDLELVEQWPTDPPAFIEGEPITRTLSLKADGLASAQLPDLPTDNVEGLKFYPDQAMLNDVHNDTGITGYRVQKVAMIATRPGTIELPAIEIPWWNTQKQTRQVARIPARTIQVKAAAVEQADPPQQPQAIIMPESSQPGSAIDERQISMPPLPVTSTSAVWPMLALFMTLGWMLTVLAWIYQSKGKTAASSTRKGPRVSIKKRYAMLVAACKQQDAVACRRELLTWGRLLFPHQYLTGLRDLASRVPQQLAEELYKIDAVLYGRADSSIDFALIQRQTRNLMREVSTASVSATDALEPLYK